MIELCGAIVLSSVLLVAMLMATEKLIVALLRTPKNQDKPSAVDMSSRPTNVIEFRQVSGTARGKK